MSDGRRFYVLVTRTADRERFLYSFGTAGEARGFVTRWRGAGPGGTPSPYAVSDPREARGLTLRGLRGSLYDRIGQACGGWPT